MEKSRTKYGFFTERKLKIRNNLTEHMQIQEFASKF